jgi:ADP-ribose pyrophosphatase YjhB (NUDIX family)
VCVGTVVLDGGRVLLVRQARGHSLEGQWTIPWGIVEADESPETAAERETLEEGGIAARIEGLLGIQNLPEAGWIAILYLCRHVSGTPTPDGGNETDAAAYFSVEQLNSHSEPIEPLTLWLARRVLEGRYPLIPPQPENPFAPRLAFL